MVNVTTTDVYSLIQERGAMGLVLEILKRSEEKRTKKNFQEIKEKLLLIPSGIIDVEKFKQDLLSLIDKEELIIVSFRKVKKNGKVGHKKGYTQGIAYYVGDDVNNLSKIYIHWKQDKKFLMKNIDALRIKESWLKVVIIDCMPNSFLCNLFLFDSEKNYVLADISLYVGYTSE